MNIPVLFSDVLDVRQLVGLIVVGEDAFRHAVSIAVFLQTSIVEFSTPVYRPGEACTCFLVGCTLNLYACLDMLFLQSLIFLLNQAGKRFLHTLLRHRCDDLEKRMGLFPYSDGDSYFLMHMRIVSLCIQAVK